MSSNRRDIGQLWPEAVKSQYASSIGLFSYYNNLTVQMMKRVSEFFVSKKHILS